MTRDLARLGQLCQVTPSHAKSPNMLSAPIMSYLAKKKMPRPSLPQGIPIPQTWPISGTWPRQPRHPMSHPNDLRAAQFHCNIVDSIHVSSLYARRVMTTVTTFKELQLQHGMQIYLPSLIAHSIILSKFKNSFPW